VAWIASKSFQDQTGKCVFLVLSHPKIKVFLDLKDIEIGSPWQPKIFYPIYLYAANPPTYMRYRNYFDCREGDKAKIQAACPILIPYPVISVAELLKYVYRKLESKALGSIDQSGLIQLVHRSIIEKFRQGRRLIIAIDEAQILPNETRVCFMNL
jgi:hypothetical protein